LQNFRTHIVTEEVIAEPPSLGVLTQISSNTSRSEFS
jgi:hypothetical protein